MTLNCTHALFAGGSSLLQKIINQQNLNHSFWPLLAFRLFRKKFLPPYFFLIQRFNFLQVLDSEPRFWKSCSWVCCQTMTYNEWNWSKHLKFIQHFMFWEILQVSGSNETPFPEVTKLRFLFTRCSLFFTRWLS